MLLSKILPPNLVFRLVLAYFCQRNFIPETYGYQDLFFKNIRNGSVLFGENITLAVDFKIKLPAPAQVCLVSQMGVQLCGNSIPPNSTAWHTYSTSFHLRFKQPASATKNDTKLRKLELGLVLVWENGTVVQESRKVIVNHVQLIRPQAMGLLEYFGKVLSIGHGIDINEDQVYMEKFYFLLSGYLSTLFQPHQYAMLEGTLMNSVGQAQDVIQLGLSKINTLVDRAEFRICHAGMFPVLYTLLWVTLMPLVPQAKLSVVINERLLHAEERRYLSQLSKELSSFFEMSIISSTDSDAEINIFWYEPCSIISYSSVSNQGDIHGRGLMDLGFFSFLSARGLIGNDTKILCHSSGLGSIAQLTWLKDFFEKNGAGRPSQTNFSSDITSTVISSSHFEGTLCVPVLAHACGLLGSEIVVFFSHVVFEEIALGVKDIIVGLGLGIGVVFQDKDPDPSDKRLHILIGANFAEAFPISYIVYQMEQLSSPYISDRKYLEILQGAIGIWDFSPNSVEHWKQLFGHHVFHIPVAVSKSFVIPSQQLHQRNMHSSQPIDILFYGLGNARRYLVYESFKGIAEKLKLNIIFDFEYGLFGEKRHTAVQQAKVVLNIHFYENAALEVHRINYLLAQGKCVVSERSIDKVLDKQYEGTVLFAQLNMLANIAFDLLNDEKRRAEQEYKGPIFVKKINYDASDKIKEALSDACRCSPYSQVIL